MEKPCRLCGQVKPLDEFHLTGRGNYRKNICKPCANARLAERRVMPRVERTDKRCIRCGEIKPLDAFFIRRVDGKEYRRSRCKQCEYTLHNAWKSANRRIRRSERGLPAYREVGKRFYQCSVCHEWRPLSAFMGTKSKNRRKQCAECLHRPKPIITERRCVRCGIVKPTDAFSRSKKRYVKSWCKECGREVKRRWRLANLTHTQEYQRGRYITHRQQILDTCERRRARKANAPRVERIDRAAIIARDGGKCYLCGCLPTGRDLTLDHVIPLAKGGTHTADNLRVACRSCNSSKGATVMLAYLSE